MAIEWDDIVKYAKREADKLGPEYTKRLEFEINEIEKQAASEYYIQLLNDKKKYDTNKNGLVLPFILKITNIDPIKNNVGHVITYEADFPDIDSDFLPHARDSVKKFISDKFGADKVCTVGNWNTLGVRQAVLDSSRILGADLDKANAVTKNLSKDFEELIDLDDMLSASDEFRSYYESNREVVELALRLVGKIKSQGQHAGGVIISSVHLADTIPMSIIKGKQVSQWTEGMASVQLSKFGLVKFDILGLNTLAYNTYTEELVKKNRGVIIDWSESDPTCEEPYFGYETYPDGTKIKILMNDPLAIKLADNVKTDAVFQFDTPVAKGVLSNGVKTFFDLVTYTALARPGPMECIPEWVARRDDPKQAWKKKEDPRIAKLLEKTFGEIIYQEDLTNIWMKFGGLTAPEAEKARKAVAKKKRDEVSKLGPKIISGMIKSGFKDDPSKPDDEGKFPQSDPYSAQGYWSRMIDFGRYCFNKCLDGDTIIVNPVTKESIAIAELYNNKRDFKLLSFDNGFVVDDVVDVHYNGILPVFKVFFDNGIEQTVTINHRFMNEFGEFETIANIMKSGHAIKFVNEKECGLCHIKRIEFIGFKATYSPEMKSGQHNYLTSPYNGQPIHANSHAMAYGIVAYRALWLKAHYPPEFWASILTYCKLESKPKYVSVAKAEGVNFRPLRVGVFSDRFTVDKDLNVYPSLSMVKGIGDSAAKNYSVDGGSCTSFDDFLVKYGKSKAVMERLIKLGAFDDIEPNRNGLWNWYLYKYCSKSEDVDAVRKNINDKIIGVEWPADKIKIERERQLDEFKKLFPKKKPLKRITEWEPKIGYKYDYPTIKEVINLFDDYTLKEKLMFEKEYLGVYWTDPMQLFECDREYCFENAKVEEDYYVDGIVEGFNDARTKNGKRFRNYNVSDGVETNAIKIWEDSIKYQDEEVYKPGCGVRVPVKWSEKYHSFSLQRNCSIVSLRSKRVTS